MEPLFIVAIILIISLAAAAFFIIREIRKNSAVPPENGQLLLMQQQLQELSRTLDSKLGESRQEMTSAVRQQFSASQQLIQEISRQMTTNLTEMTREQTRANETTREFLTIGQKLGDLEKVLKSQKQRGNLGEASLELILSNILPPDAYELQHPFKNKEVVDAVIKTRDGVIPVDAKFSLDSYQRVVNANDEAQKEAAEKDFSNDLKKRIDETSKYIRPDEGTLPFAFMFIPAEGIYYDLLVNQVGAGKVNSRNLIDYAYNDKKVVVVSPTTFAAYLQSVLYGFKAFRVEEEAKNIIKRVEELGRHMKAQEDFMNKLGDSLQATVNNYGKAYKELAKADRDVLRITGVSNGIEPLEISGPTHKE
jgi:DNA recombination protein RmuC